MMKTLQEHGSPSPGLRAQKTIVRIALQTSRLNAFPLA